ncbi:hypothetical protein BBOV_I004060 [Babesia bovis T2Bo]|uniref:Uncharacterized protein n=1 Tax=Babesia bovis TaxID=5865 RepID=A7AWQ9_BABBO|nr:hypothetical protein BBOV_I004060 [Babesia bovis T2Bo]EDO05487.1 hypothetical protein BBOV_I004060 [Babesia bovis T2Bo]BAN64655.1 conserved hypothetical protein [Babesia bovis]|eukprot:XP_001609055.1 hypothetical protein [Babesia bovis T2Bo]
MVVVGLYVRAQMDNVAALRIPEKHYWTFALKDSVGYETRDFVTISDEQLVEAENTRNVVHASISFKETSRRGTITIKTVKGVTQNEITEPNKFTCIGAFDCRGLDITQWYPRGGYEVVCESGTVIPDVEFDATGAWVGFDEKAGVSVSVMELEYELRTL